MSFIEKLAHSNAEFGLRNAESKANNSSAQSARGIERSEWIKARKKLLGHSAIDLLGLRVVE